METASLVRCLTFSREKLQKWFEQGELTGLLTVIQLYDYLIVISNKEAKVRSFKKDEQDGFSHDLQRRMCTEFLRA